jgi:hypothetical protein
MFFLLFLLDDGRIGIRIHISDSDLGGPKTYGSYGSRSATLLLYFANMEKEILH